jgi:hypothetical protein
MSNEPIEKSETGMWVDYKDCEKLKNEIKELKDEVNRLRPFSFLTTMEWQPIETAPKDGTEILAYEKCDYLYSNDEIEPFERIKIVRWNEVMQWDNPEDEYDWMTGSSFDEQINPTHWMPLPKPPTK